MRQSIIVFIFAVFNKVEFIFNVRLGTKGCLARELIDEHRKEFADLNSGDPYTRKNIATAKVNWKYDPRPVDGKPASNTASAELYYHMFYDPVIYQEAANKLSGQTAFSPRTDIKDELNFIDQTVVDVLDAVVAFVSNQNDVLHI